MSEQIGGTGPLKTGLWSVGTKQTPTASAPAASPTPDPRVDPAGDAGSFDGAQRLQAASTAVWSGGGLGASNAQGGTWTAGWEVGSAPVQGQPGGGHDAGTGGVKLWTVDAPMTAALRELETAAQALATMRNEALAELQAIRTMASTLSFAQGGDVDALKVGRAERFEQNLVAAEKALQKQPMDVEAYRRHLGDLRTILQPPLTPKLPNGDSRHQTYWGKPVPGSQAVMTKLTDLLNRAGFAGTKVTPTLYELRGNVTQAQSKVDTLRNAAEQRAAIQAKSAEFGQAKAAAEQTQNQYQQAVFRTGGLFEDFFKGALQALDAMPASPEVAEARAELLRTENALKLSYFGSANQFLGQFAELAGKVGLNLDGLKTLREAVTDAGRLLTERNKAQDRAQRVDQELARMRAGYDEVFR